MMNWVQPTATPPAPPEGPPNRTVGELTGIHAGFFLLAAVSILVGFFYLGANKVTTYSLVRTHDLYSGEVIFTVSCAQKWSLGTTYSREYIAQPNPMLPTVNEAIAKSQAEKAYKALKDNHCHPYDTQNTVIAHDTDKQ